MSGKLNEKQEVFCLEYIKDLNATQAAIRAGYSENTARSQGQRLLTHVDVQELIAKLKAERCDELKTDAAYVLKRLREIDELDIIDILKDDLSGFRPLNEWPKSWRISISGFDMKTIVEGGDQPVESLIQKIKWPDKTKNLELIGKHVDVGAFNGERAIDDSPIGKIEIEVVGANSNN